MVQCKLGDHGLKSYLCLKLHVQICRLKRFHSHCWALGVTMCDCGGTHGVQVTRLQAKGPLWLWNKGRRYHKSDNKRYQCSAQRGCLSSKLSLSNWTHCFLFSVRNNNKYQSNPLYFPSLHCRAPTTTWLYIIGFLKNVEISGEMSSMVS